MESNWRAARRSDGTAKYCEWCVREWPFAVDEDRIHTVIIGLRVTHQRCAAPSVEDALLWARAEAFEEAARIAYDGDKLNTYGMSKMRDRAAQLRKEAEGLDGKRELPKDSIRKSG